MNELKIESKKDTLEIICTSGKIDISGNSILPNAITFFKPVFEWATKYVENPAKLTEVTLKIEYIDTSSVQALFDLLKLLKDIPNYESRLVVNWYFEFDDPELLEVGEIIDGRLKLNMNFIEFTL